MTNRHDNWRRLLQVIDWAGMTVNYFAGYIGLQRAENLYHIKKGNYGISADLADRIVHHFPAIDRTWLISGVGSMLLTDNGADKSLPYFRRDITEVIPQISELEPDSRFTLPYNAECDFVVRSSDEAMNETLAAATDLFLREVDAREMVQGNEYVLAYDDRVVWRKVRLVANDAQRWRLVATNREEFPDIFVDKSSVARAWRVVVRMAILES